MRPRRRARAWAPPPAHLRQPRAVAAPAGARGHARRSPDRPSPARASMLVLADARTAVGLVPAGSAAGEASGVESVAVNEPADDSRGRLRHAIGSIRCSGSDWAVAGSVPCTFGKTHVITTTWP
eukprot:5609225-Prymnesium_polylepis.1